MINLFPYRGLIWNFIKRDISSKYVGSFIGVYWSIINPIITLVVYIIVFGVFLHVRLPGNSNIWDFALYFSAGFLPWITFNESVVRGSRAIIDNKHYIKKVPFPNEIFPVYITFAELINLFIGIGIYLVLFVFLKAAPGIYLLLLPVAIVLQLLFTLALNFLLSSSAVYFRDVPQILGAVFMIWFWATPIAYTLELIPAGYQWIERLNPAYYMIEIYRDALFYGRIPDISIILPFSVFCIGLFIIGVLVFSRVKRGFGELL